MLVESAEYFEGVSQYEEMTWNVSASFLLKVLDKFLLIYSKIYLVLDALDEAVDQESIVAFVLDLHKRNSGVINIAITSRQERTIQQALETSTNETMILTAENVDQDIRDHIQKRLTRHKRIQNWPEAPRKDIEATLAEGASGMLGFPSLLSKLSDF